MNAAVPNHQDRFAEILNASPVDPTAGEAIGRSRAGRAVRAFRFGYGGQQVSLLAGCHADEPVGPRLLRHLCGYLGSLSHSDPLLEEFQWWVVPDINPDGAERNRAWQHLEADRFDLVAYLRRRIRELPGDDIEFSFPTGSDDIDARPENHAVFGWWKRAEAPFTLHVSLHGMGFAAGPWFLIEEEWKDRCEQLKKRCTDRVRHRGYELHDVERRGEKGFFRLGKGFCTRPDSRHMRAHFLDLGDEQTAALFRPSSMETIRSFGGDPLTLVSEMPLFLTPGVGKQLGPPDPVTQLWKQLTDLWTVQLLEGKCTGEEVSAMAAERGLVAMPIRDQMDLQWTFIAAGLEQAALANPLQP